MVRVGGLTYACEPAAAMGRRIQRPAARRQADRRRAQVQGRRLGAGRRRGAQRRPKPVWEVVEPWLKRSEAHVAPRRLNTPRLIGVDGNPGLA